ncbi:inositol monophosphatase family protein [Streptomyces sp. NBC_00670]|jgi:fructose-1,6-bisphosphatase/inositol monophosphatase family enzyme|uniref:inositol monophosphatase family protein n=1 Tax=Streptomyces sp. NBC_00670 TaxID=2975804 RepID=UPI002E369341|nr:inositol monophosphatase family protein [Streptomyces sp. NBC_00670]
MIESTYLSTGTIDEFLTRHADDVEAAVRRAAATEIMPRFRRLEAREVDEKTGPHDLVTDADRNAEAYLTEELARLLPGSVVVGEEAVHADPRVYEAIRGQAPVWIVDPVDGTRQFVHGDTGFCTLVALARGGELLASWTYAPAREQFATALRGRGAFLDGTRLHAGSPEPAAGLEVATSHPDYTTDAQKEALLGLRTEGVRPRPCGSAGLEYLAVARGELDATAFTWEAAWDHAAGLLLVEEAGGAHLTRAGVPFRITGGNALPFSTARDGATARRVVELLGGAR